MAASVKLTKSIREQIIQSVMKDAFVKERAELEARRLALSVEIYNTMYSEEIRKAIKVLPVDFLSQTRSMIVYVEDGFGRSLSFLTRFMKDTSFSAAAGYMTPELRDGSTYEKCLAHREATKLIDTQEKEVRARVTSVVNSVNTTARLIEIWPECTQFLPAELLSPPAKALVPAVIMEGFNDMLFKVTGKPVVEQAA